MRVSFWSATFLALTSALAYGRLTTVAYPEDFAPLADLICTGTVLAVTDAHETLNPKYPNIWPPIDRENWMQARIKILHVFRGAAPAEIVVRFRASANPSRLDGPSHPRLTAGKRYRFFLKFDLAKSGYVNVLDGQIDDEYAVETMGHDERDDALWLTRAQAIELARAYVVRMRPELIKQTDNGAAIDLDPERKDGAGWLVIFRNEKKGREGSIDVYLIGGEPVQVHTGTGMWNVPPSTGPLRQKTLYTFYCNN